MKYELLALDVDGTILDDQGLLRDTVRTAVTAAQARGVRVVLCTGRRYRTSQPFADALGLDGPIVVQNGAVVRDLATGALLHSALLPSALYEPAYQLMSEVGGPLAYLHEHPDDVDFCFEPMARVHAFQREYLDDYGHNGLEVASLALPPHASIVMLSLMADDESLHRLYERAKTSLGSAVRTHLLANRMYRGSILEIASPGAGKWTALSALAGGWGIPSERIVAIGDDRNDMEMLAGAGLGIAMGNAPTEVRASADIVTATNEDDGVVCAIDEHVLRN